jgi:hypothetical protein
MAQLKSQRHHWWPECVSEFWKDDGGCVNWLLPNGEVRKAPPRNFGVIGNAHHIKLGPNPSEATVWDQSFESEFQRADDNFPRTIKWLSSLHREACPHASTLTERFLPQNAPDEEIGLLVEGLVSLAVRSPMNRESAVSLAEHFRGPLPDRERNTLIGLNMRDSQRMTVDSIGTRGKLVVIYSPDREFIFGDGFFHNIASPSRNPIFPKILAPLTPRISVLFSRPTQYTINPKLSTLVVTRDEADALNNTIQIYARTAVFYRSEEPAIIEEYRRCRHLQYDGPENPVDHLIHNIPGVPPRNTSLDFLAGGPARRRSPSP